MRRQYPRTIGRGKRTLIMHDERDPQPVTRRSSCPTRWFSSEQVMRAKCKKRRKIQGRFVGWGQLAAAFLREGGKHLSLLRRIDSWVTCLRSPILSPRARRRSRDKSFRPTSLSHLWESYGFSSVRSYDEITEGRIARQRAGCSIIIQTSSWFARSHLGVAV